MYQKLLSTILILFTIVTCGYAQTGSIKGTITDSQTGGSLPGANVYISKLERGTATNAQGKFTIDDVPAGTYTLKVTYIGYTTKRKTVQINNGSTTVNFKLEPSSQSLDKIVVVGFGQTKKKNLTSSVSSVSSQEIEEAGNLTTFEDALQGKAAGVKITRSSGTLGSPVSVRVRGTTSINASSQPLYVVDGVPLTDAGGSIGQNLGIFNGSGSNPLLGINPSDIKSIQVLKSATAAAVYGARGSNGVVLIQTKEGQAGETNINVEVSGGFTEPTDEYDVLTGPQFQKMANYAISQYPTPQLRPIYKQIFGFDPDNVPNTNWSDLVTQTGSIQNYKASLSGGDSKTQFYMSGVYQDQDGFVKSNRLQKYSAFAKVNHQFNDKLNVGISVNPTRTLNNRITTQNAVSAPYTSAALFAPVVPQFYPNGDINDGSSTSRAPTNQFSAFNGSPYASVKGIDFLQTTTQVNTTGHATYDFLASLSLKTQLSVQYLQVEEEGKQAGFTTDGFPNGAGSVNNNQILNYSSNNTLTYTNDWKNNSLTATLGVTFQREQSTYIAANGNNYANNGLLNLSSAAVISGATNTGTSYTFQNNLLRLNYAYKDRYLLTLTGSYNGSSRFSEDNHYGFFPAASAGWIISDEPFFNDADWLSQLKLRAGYGVTGNAEIGNFIPVSLLGAGANYNQNSGLALTALPNQDLKWERTAQFNAGIDFGFLNNRLRASVTYFNKKTSDLLLGVPISATNGFTSFTQNIGELENSGFEFEIHADIVAKQDLTWSVNANASTLHNEVTELPDNGQPGGRIINGESIIQEGEPLGAFYLVPYAGVNPDNGNAQFRDSDGNIVQNQDYSLRDRRISGDPFPDLQGGFGTTVNVKGISLNVNFNYNYGNDIYNGGGEFLRSNLASLFNQSTSQLDYWTPDNTDAPIPEPRFLTTNGSQTSTRYLSDGSYLRLKSATLGYTLPRDLVNGNKIRIYVQGTNLLTFTGYDGLDPEVETASTNNLQGDVFFQPPQQRTVTFGIQLGL